MKKHWILVTVLAFALLLAGCGQDGTDNGNGNGNGTGNGDEPALGSLELTNTISAEWRESGKQFANVYAAGRSATDCGACHDGFGFSVKDEIDFTTEWNPGGVDETMDTFPEHNTGIDCQSCHAGAGLAYMESGTVELPYATIEDAGTGAGCMFCHSGRRDTPAAFEEYAAGEATRFTYPHYGPAAVFTGQGGMEYPDRDYASTGAHANLEDSCVYCHMPETEDGYRAHNFQMDTAYIDQTCGTCHNDIGEDYNYRGFVDEIEEKRNNLLAAITEETGAVNVTTGGGQLVFEGPDGEPLGIEDVSLEAFVAGYTYYEIYAEGSHGIHNPAYARSLLDNAYEALTGEPMD